LKAKIKAVALDMPPAYIRPALDHLPKAGIRSFSCDHAVERKVHRLRCKNYHEGHEDLHPKGVPKGVNM